MLARFVCATVLLVALAAAARAQTPAADALLSAMLRADRTVQYEGTEQITREASPPVVMHVWRSGPKRRIEFTAPPVMQGDVLVDNGTDVWRYHRSEKAAVQTKSTRGGANSAQFIRRFEAKVVGSATVAGRPCWIVALLPRGTKRTVRKFWLDRATKARLRIERFAADGHRTETAVFKSIKFGAVPESKFVWSAPAGTKITRTEGTLFMSLPQAQHAASWLRAPSYLPRGYAFESAIVDPKGEAWLRYTNGLSRFSIFQQHVGSSDVRNLSEVDGAWYWQSGGNRFLVVGLSGAEVKKLQPGLR